MISRVAFKILYYEDALTDLEAIFEWSRENNPDTTEQFAGDLFNHPDVLAVFPHLGAAVKGLANLRRLLHSPLHIYYRMHAGAIDILHFWHAARRPPQF